jgi:hypothetical protein
MKILIIGSDYNWSIERIYLKELLKLGHEVQHVPVQNWYFDYYYKSKIHKVLTRLGLNGLQRKIQKLLLNRVKNEKYDLIWVFKGMEILPNTLSMLKKQTQRLINFNPDNPFIFSGKGSGNKNITRSIHLYDEHFTYDRQVKAKIETEFNLKCTLVPFGFDPEVIPVEELNDLEETNAVCFLGNPDSYRAKILQSILDKNICLHVYGNGWNDFLKHPKLTIYGPVYEKEYFKTLRKYRVQLNIMRVHNLNSHNMRSIEIPGCGGIMLAPKTKDHEAFFTENRDAFFYSNVNQLVEQVNKILKLDHSVVLSIRNNAREKVMKNFSYEELTKTFIFD